MADVPYYDLDPYLLSVQATLQLLQQLGLIPDLNPLDYIISAFDGKPKLEDTELAALRLQASPWWPLQALGNNLQIWVRNGVPLSTGNTQDRLQLSQWIGGTMDSLEPIVFNRFDPGSLNHAIWLAMTSQFGDTAIRQLNSEIANQHALGPLPTPPPQPTGPPPTPTGVGVHLSRDGDELADYGDTFIFQNSLIYDILTQISKQLGTQQAADCCTKVTASIDSITAQLTAIATCVCKPGTPPPPIDLTPIVTELAAIVTSVGALAASPSVNLDPLVAAVNSISAALSGAPPSDVAGVVDQLKQANAMMDVPQAIIDAVVQSGLVQAQDAQLAGGGPWAWINTLLHDEWRKLNHPATPDEVNAAKADPVFGPTVSAKLAGVPLPPFKEVLKMTPSVLGEIAGLAIEKVMEGAYPIGKTLYGPMIQDMLKVHENLVAQFANVQPGGEITNATKLLSEALTFGVGAHWAAIIGEKIVPGKHMGVTAIAALLAELAGFKEISQGLIDSEVEAAIARPHKYFMNLTTRSMLPTSGQAAELFSRRKIAQAQLTALMAYAGFSDQWGAALASIAYRPMSPMMLAAGFANADIDMARLQGTLEYMGIRPEDLPLAEQAIVTRSLQQTRQALVNESVTAYGQGVVSDAELSQILTDAGYGKAASQLVMQRALIARRITLAKETESFIVPEVTQGLLTADQGLQALEASGVQTWQAELKITLAETRAALNQARKALAAEARLALQRQRNLTRAAVAEYERGVLDDAGLTAALVALGLDATLIATIVAVESAKRAGRLRLAYGQLLDPTAARVLDEQVAALETQFKKQLIDETSARTQLAALKLDPAEINALVARWAAARTAATKTGYELPV